MVMLSAESASGEYPVASVKMMASVILQAESALKQYGRQKKTSIVRVFDDQAKFFRNMVCLADDLSLDFIVCPATSLSVIRLLAQFRPKARIIAITDSQVVQRECAFLSGVTSLRVNTQPSFSDLKKVITEQKKMQLKNYLMIALDGFSCQVEKAVH
jgi:pyruvate kinase